MSLGKAAKEGGEGKLMSWKIYTECEAPEVLHLPNEYMTSGAQKLMNVKLRIRKEDQAVLNIFIG